VPKIVSEQGRQQMRKQIIRAAVGQFARHGFAESRLDTIAKLAGIGKGTIYLYFPSKEDLFVAMLQELTQEELTQIHHALRGKQTLKERLEALLTTFTRLLREQPEEFRVVISALYGVNRQFQHEAAVQRRQFLTLIEEILREAQAAGEITVDVETAALVILTLVSDSLALLAEVLGLGQDYILARQTYLMEMLVASFRLDAAS
jgi:AcrR family transcriptional regulator